MEIAKRQARIAIVHPWFLAHGGAEHVVDVLAAIYPQADFFTLFYTPESLPKNLRGRKITALKVNWLPFKYTIYRYLLALYPAGFEQLDLRYYDLVISSDSCVAKCVIVDQGARHICYCHSPMRALWDKRFEFQALIPYIVRPIYALAAHLVRQWDFTGAQRVDRFIANSKYVAERIERYYCRESEVIYPPVVLQTGAISSEHGDYYLFVGRLTETKRVDLLVEACNKLKRRFIVVGGGRYAGALKKLAGPTVEFPGHVSNEELANLYRGCKALLFAADEDFGIVPVEAQGYGRPIIAYGHGGLLETVVEIGQTNAAGQPLAPTGVFFAHQSIDSVCEAILEFEAVEDQFDPAAIRHWAEQFTDEKFAQQVRAVVAEVAEEASLSL